MRLAETKESVIGVVGKDLRKALGTLFILGVFVNVLMLTSSVYMLQVLDRVLSSGSGDTLFWLTVMAILALSVYGVLELARRRILVRMGMIVESELSPAALDSALLLGQKQDVQAHVTAIKTFLSGESATAFLDAPWTPLFLFGIALIDPWLGVLSLVGLILLFLASLLNDRSSRPFNIKQRQKISLIVARSNEISRYFESVRALGMRQNLIGQTRKMGHENMNFNLSGLDKTGGWMAFSKWLRMVLQTGILALGAWLTLKGDITSGGMIAASILLGRAAAPVERSMGAWQAMILARTSWTELKDLFFKAEKESEGQAVLPAPKGALEIQNISATPLGAEISVFSNLSGSIEPGTVLAVAGPSGSGKTTLGKMIVGLQKPDRGAILLDVANVSHRSDVDLGQFVGYVPQSLEVLSGTILDNIRRFGDGDEASVLEAARMAGAHDFIATLPQGYMTPVGMGGVTLSGGQLQKLALARAFYGNPHLLVLDEPSFGQDDLGKLALVEALREAAERKAIVILITHDRQLINVCDRLLVIQNGTGQFHEPKSTAAQEKSTNGGPVKKGGEGADYSRDTSTSNVTSQIKGSAS